MSMTNTVAAFPLIRFGETSYFSCSSLNLGNVYRDSNLPKVGMKKETSYLYATGSMGFSRGGAGLLERPTFDQSQFDPLPQLESGGDIGMMNEKKSTGGGDGYRVLLLDNKLHTEHLVVRVLPQAVPSITASDAQRLFHESRQNGVAVVIVTVKEHAEFYSQMMSRGGLKSTIEPNKE